MAIPVVEVIDVEDDVEIIVDESIPDGEVHVRHGDDEHVIRVDELGDQETHYLVRNGWGNHEGKLVPMWSVLCDAEDDGAELRCTVDRNEVTCPGCKRLIPTVPAGGDA